MDKSWQQTKKDLGLNSIQTARDYKKAADKLIKEGFTWEISKGG